jgi:peptidyl-tRNA hydrolase
VLGRFPRAEDAAVQDVVERAAAAASAVVVDGAAKAMNEFNRRRTPAG